MQIQNLTQHDVDTLKETLEGLKKDNPAIKSKVYSMEDLATFAEAIDSLNNKIRDLELWLRQTLGGHVLIKGQWIKID